MTSSSAKKRGVIYARVSTEEQRKGGYSLRSQVRLMEEKMKKDGVEAAHPPIEDVESGRNFERKGLKNLMNLAETGRIDYVYVYALDRLGRHVAETPYLMYRLKEVGVIVRTMNEEYNFDDPIDYVIVTFKSYFPDMESRSLGERTQRGKNEKFLQGKWVSSIPFGYRKNADGTLERVPGLEPIVVDIFQTYKVTGDIKKTTHTINERYSERTGKFSANQIRTILANPVYVGCPKYGETQIHALTLAMVSAELHNEVQVLMEKKAKKHKSKYHKKPRSILDDFAAEHGMDYVLHVLTLLKPHCPKCNTQMVGNGSKSFEGLRLPNFKCPVDGYQRTIPSISELKHFRKDMLSCPKCKSVENFSIEKTLNGFIEYTCRRCDLSFRLKEDEEGQDKLKTGGPRRKFPQKQNIAIIHSASAFATSISPLVFQTSSSRKRFKKSKKLCRKQHKDTQISYKQSLDELLS